MAVVYFCNWGGGSMLIIGSAAGIIAMSKVKALTFMSYLKMSVYLLIAYTVGYYGSHLAAFNFIKQLDS